MQENGEKEQKMVEEISTSFVLTVVLRIELAETRASNIPDTPIKDLIPAPAPGKFSRWVGSIIYLEEG